MVIGNSTEKNGARTVPVNEVEETRMKQFQTAMLRSKREQW
jgi:hypothetical protein